MRYFIRSVKYLLMLITILVVITLFMNFAGDIELSYREQFDLFMVANNGALKICFFVMLSALFPLFGYVGRNVEGSVVENRGQIDVAMESSGFSFEREGDGKLYYRANTFLRRLTFLFEDVIVVEQRGENIHIEGVRRGVVYVVYCLEGFIKNSKRGE
ncbi:MAG: hypothetical protein SNH73_03860 [Rikenellaceae bacterium]